MSKKKAEPTSFNLGLVLLFAFAHLGHHLPGALIVPLSPFIRDHFDLDYTRSGWVVSAYLICYGISQLPGGWLSDRIGPRTLITIGISGVAIAGLLAGLSVNYIMLLAFLALAGILGGGYHPSSVPLISGFTVSEKRGRALGIHQIGGAASHFLGPLIASALVIVWGWRGAFIAPAILIFFLGIVLNVLIKKKTGPRTDNNSLANDHLPVRPHSKISRHLIAFMIFAIVADLLIASTVVFIPLFLVDHFQFSDKAAAATLAVVYSGGLWAGPLSGYFSDRVGSLPVLLFVTLLACPIIFFFNIIPLGWGIYIFLFILGIGQFARMPVNEIYLINNIPERHRSTILGIYYFGSRGGPGVVAPLIGYIADHFGFGVSFGAIGIILFIVTVCCSLFIWKDKA
ncbi:MAG: MFS transporter [Dehalococcoidia bacterium]